MADKKPRAPRFMAPRGPFVFPKLNVADTKFKSQGEFAVKVRYQADDAAVQAFIAKLQPLHDTAVANADIAFKAMDVKARKAFETKGVKGAVVNPLYTTVYDETTEEPTGEIEFKFGGDASGKVQGGKHAGRAWFKRPTIVDAKGKTLVAGTDFSFLDEVPGATLKTTVFKKMGPPIWGGSEGICAIEVGLGKDGEPGYFIPGTAACGLSLRLRGVQLLKLVQGGSSDLGFGQEEGYESDGSADAVSDDAETSAETSDDGDF